MKILLRLTTCLIISFVVTACSKKEEQPTTTTQPPKEKAPSRTVYPVTQIPVVIPKGHHHISVVVDNAEGRRVRNLVRLGTAETISGKPEPDGSVKGFVSWDGKDDRGNMAPPGRYTIRGVTVPEVDPLYEYSFYNPGTPPWHGYPNSSWGANHGDGVTMACIPAGVESPIRTIIGFNGSEGTDCIIAVDKNDRKFWAFQQGWGSVSGVAANKDYFFYGLGNSLRKHNVSDQKQAAFKRPAGSVMQLALPCGPIGSIALDDNNLALTSLVDPKNPKPLLMILDAETGRTNAPIVTLNAASQVGYGADHKLYLGNTNGFYQVVESGTLNPVTLPDMTSPGPFTFDAEKNLYIFDTAPASRQIKVYSPDLSKVIRTIGRAGGHPLPQYDPLAFHKLQALAVDDRGFLWTSEGAHPRRQAVWDRDGKLVKEFVGSTYYGNWNGKLHDQNSRLASVKGVILEVDPSQTQSYRVKQFMSSGPKPGAKDFLSMGVGFVNFEIDQLLTSDISGKPHEYFLYNAMCQPVLFLQNNKGDYRPVAGVFMKWLPPSLDLFRRPQDPDKTMYVWSDINRDEIITEDEVVVLPDAGSNGWPGTQKITKDLILYGWGYEIKPTRFTEDGAPIYEKSTIRKIGPMTYDGDRKINGNLTRIGNHILGGWSNPQNIFVGEHVFMDLNGKVVATFPVVGGGVHGSMAVPMQPKGQPVGELYVAGTVDLGGEQGSIAAIHGNYGQVYFFTEDGILIEDMFKDSRDTPEGWGESVQRGKSWKNVSMLQECFGSWFGKQDDGKLRYCFGHTSADVVEITGLDQFKRFIVGDVEIPPAK